MERLLIAIEWHRSLRYCLRVWSKFIRERDGHRCVICGSESLVSAHHIIRRSFMPMMQFETGNGITLCRQCHREPHVAFNGRPDLMLPMDYQGGENLDLVTIFFMLLLLTRRHVVSLTVPITS